MVRCGGARCESADSHCANFFCRQAHTLFRHVHLRSHQSSGQSHSHTMCAAQQCAHVSAVGVTYLRDTRADLEYDACQVNTHIPPSVKSQKTARYTCTVLARLSQLINTSVKPRYCNFNARFNCFVYASKTVKMINEKQLQSHDTAEPVTCCGWFVSWSGC